MLVPRKDPIPSDPIALNQHPVSQLVSQQASYPNSQPTNHPPAYLLVPFSRLLEEAVVCHLRGQLGGLVFAQARTESVYWKDTKLGRQPGYRRERM